jgi:hypothetical protein
MHARAKRKRSRAAAVTGKTDDTLACLRGAVNEVQKKKRIVNIIDDRDPCFIWVTHRLAASACPCVQAECITIILTNGLCQIPSVTLWNTQKNVGLCYFEFAILSPFVYYLA